MPEADIDRIYDYDPNYLADILASVKTIAMVGASADKTKFSYGVLRQLSEIGYDILPVNPNRQVTEIRGLKVYRSLAEIDKPVDMVDVFRRSEAVRSCLHPYRHRQHRHQIPKSRRPIRGRHSRHRSA